MTFIENGGLELVLWLQTWPIPHTLLSFLHFMGAEGLMLTLPLIYWCINPALGRRLLLLITLSSWSNAALKEAWQLPRPFMISSQVKALVKQSGYGFPSGHTQSAAFGGGILAYHLKRSWFTSFIVLYVILMMLSRIASGVHFPQDVIGGSLIGLSLLVLYVGLERRVSCLLRQQSLKRKIGLVIANTTAMLIVHPLLIPVSSQQGLNAISTFAGLGIGFALESDLIRFRPQGRLSQYILRFGIGAAILLLLFSTTPFLPQPVRYLLIGLWISAGAPWLFVKLRLASSSLNISPLPHLAQQEVN